MDLRIYLSLLVGKLVLYILKFFKKSASTWPGEIALRIYPAIYSYLAKNTKVIYILGTNGKTTTVKLIFELLKNSGKSVISNFSGANLDNGLTTEFINSYSFINRKAAEYAVFEVDEMTLERIIKFKNPHILIFLNLFRDQLDRYGEVDLIAKSFKRCVQKLDLETKIVICGEDPELVNLVAESKCEKYYFGLGIKFGNKDVTTFEADSIFCPKCGRRLIYNYIIFSHIGGYKCEKCEFKTPKLNPFSEKINTNLIGTYNLLNLACVELTSQILKLDNKLYFQTVSDFKPAFGRQEEIKYKDKTFKILLSKNPTGMNESLRTYIKHSKSCPLIIALNDNIPDGKDVSWVWDSEFELLSRVVGKNIYLTGSRAYDLAVRLKHSGIIPVNVSINIENTIGEVIMNKHNYVWVLPTYSAMLETRKILLGREIN